MDQHGSSFFILLSNGNWELVPVENWFQIVCCFVFGYKCIFPFIFMLACFSSFAWIFNLCLNLCFGLRHDSDRRCYLILKHALTTRWLYTYRWTRIKCRSLCKWQLLHIISLFLFISLTCLCLCLYFGPLTSVTIYLETCNWLQMCFFFFHVMLRAAPHRCIKLKTLW